MARGLDLSRLGAAAILRRSRIIGAKTSAIARAHSHADLAKRQQIRRAMLDGFRSYARGLDLADPRAARWKDCANAWRAGWRLAARREREKHQ